MKSFVIVFLIGLYLMIGNFVHSNVEDSLIKESEILLKENGFKDLKVVGINLPYTFTFLFEDVETNIFYQTDDGNSGSLEVEVKHISNSVPLIGILFSDYKYIVSIPQIGLLNLMNQN